MRATATKAASVWRTSGWPATRWYCLGWAVPARAAAGAGQQGKAAGASRDINNYQINSWLRLLDAVERPILL
jgi:hypothetical protein